MCYTRAARETYDMGISLHTLALLARVKARLQAIYGDRLGGGVLYGSEAQGEAAPDSDIDILILLTGPVALVQFQ